MDQKKGKSPLYDDVSSLRKDLVRLLLLAVPGVLVNLAVSWFKGRFLEQPWQGLWVLLPLLIALWICWQYVKGRRQFVLRGLFLYFFLAYVCFFSAAVQTRILDWQRSLVGYEKTVPKNWLALNWMGDWRYRLTRKVPAQKDLIVVLVPPLEGRTLEEGRFEIARLLRMAASQGAKGIAFDFFFRESTRIDPLLCQEMEEARGKGMAVIGGYNFAALAGQIVREEIAASLQPCLPLEAQGHLVGYGELDGKIRSIPAYFKGAAPFEALSVKIARVLEKKIALPEDGLIQFLPPQKEIQAIPYQELERQGLWDILRDNFILVGEDSPRDRFETPFGIRAGAVIHAYAVHSLRQDHLVQRTGWRVSFPVIFSYCYFLTLLFALGVSTRKIFFFAVLLSLAVVAAAAAAITFWLAWFDVVYPLFALWLILPGLVLLRRYHRRNASPPPPTQAPKSG